MLRARFSKENSAVWISHLDLMRVLARSFRRAGLLLKHSQGFTPHPSLSLAQPLSVGMYSGCELMDFELDEGCEVSPEELRERLNRALPAGITIHEVYEGGRKLRELTHLRVELRLTYDGGIPADGVQAIAALLARDTLPMEKRTKSGAPATIDLRQLMGPATLTAISGTVLRMECVICAQNPTLNPALIPALICRELPALTPDGVTIRRLEMLDATGERFT